MQGTDGMSATKLKPTTDFFSSITTPYKEILKAAFFYQKLKRAVA